MYSSLLNYLLTLLMGSSGHPIHRPCEEMLNSASRSARAISIYADYLEKQSSRMQRLRHAMHFLDFEKLAQVGSLLEMNGNSYTVLAILGEGSEGISYLVTKHSDVFVIKQFKDEGTLVRNVKKLNVLAQSQVAIAGILEQDLKNLRVRFKFVFGLPVSSMNEQIWQKLGFNQSEVAKFAQRLEAFGDRVNDVTDADGEPQAFFTSNNAILSFEDHKIYLIDPN